MIKTNGTFIFFEDTCYKISDISKIFCYTNDYYTKFHIIFVVNGKEEIALSVNNETTLKKYYSEITEMLFNTTNTIENKLKPKPVMTTPMNI